MSVHFVTYAELMRDADALCSMHPEWRHALGVVGVPRSGMIPASVIALRYNLPLTDLESFLSTGGRFYPDRVGRQRQCGVRGVILVDDSVNEGATLRWAVREIVGHIGMFHLSVVPVSIYGSVKCSQFPCARIIEEPRLFDWNWHRNPVLCNAMLDMDGVICEDPHPSLCGDERAYERWLPTAMPKFIPPFKVRAIVSARLERTREMTEKWLKDWGVQYEELCLIDATAQERTQRALYIPHKVEHYAKSQSPLFVESDPLQAERIHQLTGKCVLCPGYTYSGSSSGSRFYPQ